MQDLSNIKWWFFGITSLCTVISSTNVVSAQIVPDNTLPNNSEVKVEGNINKIEGGTTAGGNLFHSFEKFGVPTGSEAHFNNAVDISNIITRVTGNSISDIDGLIKANGAANLFLINPNGIVFGNNARLDIGGSFVGSTADAIGFGEDNFFSASNPDSSSLLKVNPDALFFNQVKAASIQNNSVADSGRNLSDTATTRGLRVPNGKSLLLVGGDINIDGGGLYALGGRVELGGLAGTGTVGLNGNGNNLSLSFPEGVERSDVSLSNNANVAVFADDGGSITVNARNLEMTGKSKLFAGIESGLGSEQSRAGNIDLNVTEAINISNNSLIANDVSANASGEGSDINILTNYLGVKNGASIRAGTFGKGNSGNLNISAADIKIFGVKNDATITNISASAERGSTGNAGDLNINTDTLEIGDGAFMSTGTFGKGEGGHLNITARDIQVIGTGNNGLYPSGMFASAEPGSTGNGGNLTITTDTITIKNGALIAADTFSKGRGGNLRVNAQNINIEGTSEDARFSSGLFARVRDEEGATGDGGNLLINTNKLLIQQGAEVNAGTFSKGKGGDLIINAQNLQLIGTGNNGSRPSSISIAAEPNSSADAGDLVIESDILQIEGGALISAGTFGEGEGGNLNVTATDIKVIGTGNDGLYPSGIFASAEPNSTGNGGNLTITTDSLLVQNGALIAADTHASGKGGNLILDAQNIQLIGQDGQFKSGLFARVRDKEGATGDGGDINVKTDTLLVQDNAQLAVNSLGTGTAGNLSIDAHFIQLDNNALFSADTPSNKVDVLAEQATINISSESLIMRRGSNITTNATGENVIGGNININTDLLIANENSDISANSENFRGGNVRIDAQAIFGTQFRSQPTSKSDITATGASEDLSGTVEIITPQTDPTSGSIEFPTIPVDTEIADACSTPGYANSSFTITGKGSLPPSPFKPLTGRLNRTKLATLEGNIDPQATRRRQKKKVSPRIKQIVEARGWIKTPDGRIILVAHAPDNTNSQAITNSANCKFAESTNNS